MATPSGARHRDLEQRFRDIEQEVRALAAATLQRRQLSVTEGDFAVSGGGGIVVQDGGVLRSYHDNGEDALFVGPFDGPGSTYGFLVEDRDGWGMIRAYHETDADTKVYLGHETGRPDIWLYGTAVTIDGSSHVLVQTPGHIFLDSVGGQVQVGLNASTVFIGHTTTGSAANARLETNGQLSRVTSSLRYKANVEPAAIDPAKVLSLQGRTWCDKAEADNPDATRHVGFIAEELHDAGLTEFVEYDDEGRPDAIQYDRLSVGLLAVVKDQQEQLQSLAARVAALEATP